jgi:outer membrane putative beta-barrel porin/alpha-amylase
MVKLHSRNAPAILPMQAGGMQASHSIPRPVRPSRLGMAVAAACLWLAGGSVVHAQEIEPRSYSNTPVGVNFLIIGYAHTEGGLSFGTLPITNADLKTDSTVLAYARAFDLAGMSAKFDVIVPYTWLSGSAVYRGDSVQRVVDGFVDPKFRVSVNFYGAPALSLQEFRAYEQDLIIGASLQVSAPWGQYDSSRLVNIGTNRWYFKPELGISKADGPWTLELTAAATLYTDNTDFFGGNTRAQDPLYSAQAHVIYGFSNGIWVSLDTTYFTGGRTTLNGRLNDDRQENWRVGSIVALPVDRLNSIKLNASSGSSARTGNNYDLFGIAWQHRWGGGL